MLSPLSNVPANDVALASICGSSNPCKLELVSCYSFIPAACRRHTMIGSHENDF